MPTLMEGVKPVVLVKHEFECRKKLEEKCFFFKFLDYQDSDAMNKIDTSPLKQFTSGGKRPTET